MKVVQAKLRNILFLGILSGLVGFSGLLFTLNLEEAVAQQLFFADFELKGTSKARPSQKVNEAAEWNKMALNPKLVNWGNVEHAGSGRLFQTRNTNPMTTNTLIPAPKSSLDWTDYTVEMEVSYDDNDKWVIVFRWTSDNDFYMWAIEAADGNPKWYLRKGPAADGNFNGTDIVGSQNFKPKKSIDQGANNGNDNALKGPVGTDFHIIKVSAIGSTITGYFDDVKLVEVKDTTHSKGTVGIRNDTIVGTVDNFVVYGPKGNLPVQPQGNIAATWGRIKDGYGTVN